MTTAFRDTALRCPVCGTALEVLELSDAVVDRCATCAGVWIDWFDGSLRDVARRVPVSRAEGARADGTMACPRCHRPLEPEPAPGTDNAVFRCPECVGTFVPRAVLEPLASYRPDGAAGPRRSMWLRLVAVVRALLGWR